jgi:hypothetical protein
MASRVWHHKLPRNILVEFHFAIIVFLVFAEFHGKNRGKIHAPTPQYSQDYPLGQFSKLTGRTVDFICAPPYSLLFISGAEALLERKLLSRPPPTVGISSTSASARRVSVTPRRPREIIRLVFSRTYKHLCLTKNQLLYFQSLPHVCGKSTGVPYPRRITPHFTLCLSFHSWPMKDSKSTRLTHFFSSSASPLFFTLFHSCRNKSCICHSYAKYPGYTSSSKNLSTAPLNFPFWNPVAWPPLHHSLISSLPPSPFFVRDSLSVARPILFHRVVFTRMNLGCALRSFQLLRSALNETL